MDDGQDEPEVLMARLASYKEQLEQVSYALLFSAPATRRAAALTLFTL